MSKRQFNYIGLPVLLFVQILLMIFIPAFRNEVYIIYIAFLQLIIIVENIWVYRGKDTKSNTKIKPITIVLVVLYIAVCNIRAMVALKVDFIEPFGDWVRWIYKIFTVFMIVYLIINKRTNAEIKGENLLKEIDMY